jgi:hypothetical protein
VNGVSFQKKSCDRKLAPQRQVRVGKWRRNEPLGPFVSSTYVSIAATCPDTCSYKGNGCYVQSGPASRWAQKLDREAVGSSPDRVSITEAGVLSKAFPRGIPRDGARGGRDLRLHVGGDVSGRVGAWWLGIAASHWVARGGGAVWTYTHRWSSIERDAWGRSISVLASVDSLSEIADAHARGYAVAVTISSFPDGHRQWRVGDFRLVPCPAEAGASVTCATCRLCMNDQRLRANRIVIAFAEHGPGVARRRLKVLP